jgi:hypothetical protein
MKIIKYAYLLASRKRLSFCLRSFETKPYLLPFTDPPDVREKKFLFSDAWAIAEACVGFCLGFTYPPDPAVKYTTGVSYFWDFRGFVRLDKCRLENIETYIRKIYF